MQQAGPHRIKHCTTSQHTRAAQLLIWALLLTVKIPYNLPKINAAFSRTVGLRIFPHPPKMQSDLHQTFQKAVLQRGGAPEQGGLLVSQAAVNVKLK